LTSGAREVAGRSAHIVAMNDAASSTYTGKPRTYLELYRAAARTCPGLSWTILAAIGQVESGHGRDVGPSSAGALGPMQFMPATWAQWGVDADGDKKADIMDPYDAVYAAARYLCYYSPGSGLAQLKRAIFAYNHADWYVNEVLALAKLYG
jgi:membrane-bound lytic murein transglycosylase MltF